MPEKRKAEDMNKSATKKPAPKRPPKNPTDPTLLAKDVMEAFIGEPLTPTRKTKKRTSRKPSKKR